MRRRIERMKADYPLSKEEEEALITSCRKGDENEFHSGWPMLDRNR